MYTEKQIFDFIPNTAHPHKLKLQLSPQMDFNKDNQKSRKHEHITPNIRELHWLPVP